MSVSPAQVPCGDLQLEAAVYTPEAPSSAAIVVCHPHPLRGGDMRNNVVIAATRAVQAAGFTAVTFNFRGVGASQGTHDEGRGEQDDVRAALEYAAGIEGIERVGLAGYSFGADVSLSVAATSDTALPVALISLPTSAPDVATKLEPIKGPLLLIVGDADHVSASEQLVLGAQSRPADATEVVIVPGVDHFWRGAEPLLEQHVGAFFTKHLGGD
jgi:alpha/beta superfamily hydrolase